MLWPRPHSRFWQHVCENMRKDLNFKGSLWYTYLHFVPKLVFTPARVEDAIGMLYINQIHENFLLIYPTQSFIIDLETPAN